MPLSFCMRSAGFYRHDLLKNAQLKLEKETWEPILTDLFYSRHKDSLIYHTSYGIQSASEYVNQKPSVTLRYLLKVNTKYNELG